MFRHVISAGLVGRILGAYRADVRRTANLTVVEFDLSDDQAAFVIASGRDARMGITRRGGCEIA